MLWRPEPKLPRRLANSSLLASERSSATRTSPTTGSWDRCAATPPGTSVSSWPARNWCASLGEPGGEFLVGTSLHRAEILDEDRRQPVDGIGDVGLDPLVMALLERGQRSRHRLADVGSQSGHLVAQPRQPAHRLPGRQGVASLGALHSLGGRLLERKVQWLPDQKP